MTIPAYDIADSIRLGNHAGDNEDETARAAFTDITGTAADPTTVALAVKKPDGTTVAIGWPTGADGNLSKEATGRFYFDLDLTLSGLWHWKLTGTGTVETSESGAFYVRRSTT